MKDYEAFLRYTRQPPRTRMITMETAILDTVYDLVEHMQALASTTSHEEVSSTSNRLDFDIDQLQTFLRTVRTEVNKIRRDEPLSRQTKLQQ